jgi:hypothetical protein
LVCTIGLDLPDVPGHRAGQHVDARLTAEDGYTAERECSIASAPGEPLAITVERWWGWRPWPTSTSRSTPDQRFAPVCSSLSRATMSPKRSTRSQRVHR